MSSHSRFTWLIAALILSALLAAVNLYALEHFWYWHYRWFDTPMHILGGIALGAFLIWALGKFQPLLYLLGMTVVAVGWEVFEYHFGISTGQPNYWLDTQHDVLNDAIGATLAYTLARFTLWRSV